MSVAYATGNKESERSYKDGKLDGKWLLWDENGEKEYKEGDGYYRYSGCYREMFDPRNIYYI